MTVNAGQGSHEMKRSETDVGLLINAKNNTRTYAQCVCTRTYAQCENRNYNEIDTSKPKVISEYRRKVDLENITLTR